MNTVGSKKLLSPIAASPDLSRAMEDDEVEHEERKLPNKKYQSALNIVDQGEIKGKPLVMQKVMSNTTS